MNSLYIYRYDARTINVVFAFFVFSMYLKISSLALGTIPRYGSVELYLKPSIVYVLPVPVCP